MESKIDRVLMFAKECASLAHLNLAQNQVEWDPEDEKFTLMEKMEDGVVEVAFGSKLVLRLSSKN